ncbi:response regulator [Sulfurovum sp.]|uniref:response regulator n=1 Tax=Sulfurovum sp. TaxID=1969726 RepID=UPI0025DF6CB0|nr:response regulator [Sulfurovum sp.]
MNRVLHYALLVVCFSAISWAASSCDFIVVTASESNNTVNEAADTYRQLLEQDQTLARLKAREGFHADILRQNDTYLLKVGPFHNSDALTLAYLKIRSVFPQAFILEDTHSKKVIIPKTKFIEKKVYVEKEDPILWIALFGLGIIGIFALFLSSDQIKHINIKHAKMQEKQKETEKRQNLILAKMGEKIQDAVLENLESETKILTTVPSKSSEMVKVKHEIEHIKKYDDELLNTTYEMIDFLKIKSANIILHQEPFQLSMLLHKLTNSISGLLQAHNITFYYDVKTNVTRYLVGDALRIFQILHNILLNSLEDDESTNSKIMLSIEINEKEKELVFKIMNENQYLPQDKIDALFVPSSWEELQKTNKDIGFFVTNELVSQMDGTFGIESSQKKGTTYELRLPYMKDPQERSNRERLREILKGKNVHIIDDDTLNMEIFKYILESFDVKVERELTSHFRQYKPKHADWDIVILNSKDITPMHLEFFQKMRQKKGLKVILLHEIFESEDLADIALQITDVEIYSPIIPGDVEEALFQLFMAPKGRDRAAEGISAPPYEHNVNTIKITKAPKVSRESFRKFAGKDILLAEDNFVNQKVMSSILSASDIHVHKAENGREALEILKNYDIDLVLMDMNMPVMDGFAATRKIKEDPELKEIPIVAVTGLGFSHEIERMGQAGVDACIVKPFKIGQLYTAMDTYLAQDEVLPSTHQKAFNAYVPNKEILDLEQGIVNAHNEMFYREILKDVEELLDRSNEHFLSMIHERKTKELQVFSRDTLSLVETVGAVRLTKIFKEILVFLANNQDVSLEEYIPVYRTEWSRLKREIEHYLKP